MYRKFLKSAGDNREYKYSVLIPTWNNLDYLKLCIESIEKNSQYKHQIIIHINEGTDGTVEWVEQSGYDYVHSDENIGICYALNLARSLVRTDYILYMNDDMYVCPDWDTELGRAVEKSESKFFFYSSTMIEPEDTGNSCVIVGDYGSGPGDFREKELLKEFSGYKKDNWLGATWPPNIVHRDVWDLVGGYSTEFSPGMYSDPDFTMKLWNLGVRDIRGIASSRVYHFGGRSTGRLKRKSQGKKIFLNKWGMTPGNFVRYIIKRGETGDSVLSEPAKCIRSRFRALADRIRRYC